MNGEILLTEHEQEQQQQQQETLPIRQYLKKQMNLSPSDITHVIEDNVAFGNFEDSELILKYFYLYMDDLTIDHCISDKSYRHPLAQLLHVDGNISDIDISQVDVFKFPNLQDLFDTMVRWTCFYHFKIQFDIPQLSFSDFKNVYILESNHFMTLECTTTIYSFGKRILEIVERKTPIQKADRFLYQFGFADGFFSNFLNGLQFLENDSEMNIAVESLSLVQVFKPCDPCSNMILCLSFEFEVGSGYVDLFRIRDFGILE